MNNCPLYFIGATAKSASIADLALSEAIKAREALTGKKVTEAELPEFLLHNRNLIDKPVPAPEGVPPRCVHCWHLTDGVTVIGND